jgi:hypothetical protein
VNPADRKRTLWFLLALVVIFLQGFYANHRAEKARSEAMIDAAEIKALLRWVAAQSSNRSQRL